MGHSGLSGSSSLSPSSEVILRNTSLLDGDLLLVRAPADELTQHLEHTIDLLQVEAGLPYSKCRDKVMLGELEHHYSTAIIFLPREKALLRLLLEQVAAHADKIWLVGPKDHGIAGAKKVLQDYGTVSQLDVARHCRLFQISTDGIASKPLADYETTITIDIEAGDTGNTYTSLTLKSYPGVFSHGSLDAGTQLLLEHLPKQYDNVLDFGCGCGVISAFIGKRYDVNISAVDTSALAVRATQATLKANELVGDVVQAHSLDVFIAKKQRFDSIVSNPPFHAGKKDIDFTAVRTLVEQSSRCLKKGGTLTIVANAFLPYHDLLEQHFGEVKVLADNRKFKVYLAKHARRHAN